MVFNNSFVNCRTQQNENTISVYPKTFPTFLQRIREHKSVEESKVYVELQR